MFWILNVSFVKDSAITVWIDFVNLPLILLTEFISINEFVSFEQLNCKSYPPDGAILVSAGEHAVFVVKIAVNTIGIIFGRVFEIGKFISFIRSFIRLANKYKSLQNGTKTKIPWREVVEEGRFYKLAGRQQSAWIESNEEIPHTKTWRLY